MPVTLFQFTLPHRERPGMTVQTIAPNYFNSRSRTGSDLSMSINTLRNYISIHAPAQGATYRCYRFLVTLLQFQFTLPHRERQLGNGAVYGDDKFQFTLPHRERRSICLRFCAAVRFQFTLPHRERLKQKAPSTKPKTISIHAPAQGATQIS